jgi:putative iron-dependent peroxidase
VFGRRALASGYRPERGLTSVNVSNSVQLAAGAPASPVAGLAVFGRPAAWRRRPWGRIGNVTTDAAGAASAEPQAVLSPLTNAAIFLVAVINEGTDNADTVRRLCGDLAALVRAVGFRDLDGYLSCVTGFGAAAWDRLAGPPRPAGLHPFREIHAGGRHAVSTPGDVLFHIRASRMDLCFELATQVMKRLDGAVTVADEVHGFRYFDERDIIGFVDGTENPVGAAALDAAIIGSEEPAFAGGSYVIVQKYLHNMTAWNALPVEQQENVIGRTKLDDIELDDAVKPTYAHNALTTITEDGEEVKILRDNMPFGSVGTGEYGTYFIGYACTPARTELMLQNMFVGRPPGNYDRLLDVSRAVTGNLFFVPSVPLLESLADSADDAAAAADGSLNIGSLRGASGDG